MLTEKSTPEFQISDPIAQLTDALAKGRQSGEEKGWLSFEQVKQHITERYCNKN